MSSIHLFPSPCGRKRGTGGQQSRNLLRPNLFHLHWKTCWLSDAVKALPQASPDWGRNRGKMPCGALWHRIFQSVSGSIRLRLFFTPRAARANPREQFTLKGISITQIKLTVQRSCNCGTTTACSLLRACRSHMGLAMHSHFHYWTAARQFFVAKSLYPRWLPESSGNIARRFSSACRSCIEYCSITIAI